MLSWKTMAVLILLALVVVVVGAPSSYLLAGRQMSRTVPTDPFTTVDTAESRDVNIPASPAGQPSADISTSELPRAHRSTGVIRPQLQGEVLLAGSSSEPSGRAPQPGVATSSEPVPASSFTAAEGDDASKKERVTTVYSVENSSLQTILPVLASIVPNAQLTMEAKEKRLIAVATPADHETIVASLKSLEKVVDVAEMDSTRGPLSKDELQLIVYAIGEKTFQTLASVLQTTAPEAMLSVGEDDKTLIVLGKSAEHEKVCNTIRSLGKKPVDVTQMAFTRGPISKDEPQLTVYAVEEMDLQTVVAIMRTTAPEAMFTVGEDDKTLIVVAKPADHEKARDTLRSLGKKPVDPNSVGADIDQTNHNYSYLLASPPTRTPFSDAGPQNPFNSAAPPSTWPATPSAGAQSQVPSGNYPSAGWKRERADPEMAKLGQADANQGQMVAKIVEQYKAATGQEEKARVKLELEEAVNEHFSLRQQRRELEVARLEARLKKIRESIAKRYEQGQQIVNRHISELLGEGDDLEF